MTCAGVSNDATARAALGQLEKYAVRLDDLFISLAQRREFWE